MSTSAWDQLVPILVWYKALWLTPVSVCVGKEDGGAQEKGCNCSVKHIVRASLLAQTIKNLPAVRSGRSPGEGNGTPLQYSCLENSMDRGTWSVRLQRVRHDWGTNTSSSLLYSWASLPSTALLCCFFSPLKPLYWGLTDSLKQLCIKCMQLAEFGGTHTPMKSSPQSRPSTYPSPPKFSSCPLYFLKD